MLLVAEASGDPEPTPSERALLPLRHLPHQRITLVLHYPADADRPRGTAAWLEDRDVDDHLHVRAGHTGDIERLARYVSGRSVWLVLGGGGVMNNLPVDVARRETPGDTVIASDVAPVLGPRAEGDHGLSVHGAGVLARRFAPGMQAPRVPRLLPTLMRSMLVTAEQQRDRGVQDRLADLHLQFERRGVGLLDFGVVAPVAERGYEESVDALRTFLNDQRAPEAGRTVI